MHILLYNMQRLRRRNLCNLRAGSFLFVCRDRNALLTLANQTIRAEDTPSPCPVVGLTYKTREAALLDSTSQPYLTSQDSKGLLLLWVLDALDSRPQHWDLYPVTYDDAAQPIFQRREMYALGRRTITGSKHRKGWGMGKRKSKA